MRQAGDKKIFNQKIPLTLRSAVETEKDISQIDISQYDNKSIIGFIIYYDQFYRHFMRYENKNNIESIINEEIIFMG